MPRNAVRMGMVGAAACAAAVVVTAFASAPTATAAPLSGRPAANPPRCHTSQLVARTAGRNAGAGQRQVVLLLTNKSAGRCTIQGFGGVGLADRAGRQLPATDTRTGPAARPVVLSPGGSVQTTVGYGEGRGEPGAVRATYLTVIPPDERAHLSVRLDDVVYRGQLSSLAYTPATGRAFATVVRGVHVRSAPTTTASSLRTLGAAGSRVSVLCYTSGRAVSGDRWWYLTASPTTGYVSGWLLNTGRDPNRFVPSC